MNPGVPAKTLPELVALARAHPRTLTYGHAGIGTSQHLAGELFKAITQTEIAADRLSRLDRGGAGPARGAADDVFGNVVNVLPLVREGKLRAFAVTSLKRSGAAPDIPTFDESGFPGFEAVPWFGLMAPAGTPQAVIDKLHRDTVKVLAMPDVRKKMQDLGLDVIGNSPAEFAAVIASETPQWATIIKAAGIRAVE